MADQLERLFRALVHRVRDVRPENLTRPFEVGDILRTFVPYRATRAEVGVETAEDYEVLVLRLLSGERGFVFADDAMQDDLRRELDSGNPDLRALQAYGTAKLSLAQHAMRQVLEAAPAPVVPPPSSAAPDASPAPSASAPSAAPAATAAPGAAAAASSAAAPRADATPALESIQRTLPPTLAELGEAISEAVEPRPHAPYVARSSRIPDPTAESTVRTPRAGCRFCGQPLPEGREVTFCPHCGQNLKVRRCPGCSAEIEPSWKFCVTCGRASAGT